MTLRLQLQKGLVVDGDHRHDNSDDNKEPAKEKRNRGGRRARTKSTAADREEREQRDAAVCCAVTFVRCVVLRCESASLGDLDLDLFQRSLPLVFDLCHGDLVLDSLPRTIGFHLGHRRFMIRLDLGQDMLVHDLGCVQFCLQSLFLCLQPQVLCLQSLLLYLHSLLPQLHSLFPRHASAEPPRPGSAAGAPTSNEVVKASGFERGRGHCRRGGSRQSDVGRINVFHRERSGGGRGGGGAAARQQGTMGGRTKRAREESARTASERTQRF